MYTFARCDCFLCFVRAQVLSSYIFVPDRYSSAVVVSPYYRRGWPRINPFYHHRLQRPQHDEKLKSIVTNVSSALSTIFGISTRIVISMRTLFDTMMRWFPIIHPDNLKVVRLAETLAQHNSLNLKIRYLIMTQSYWKSFENRLKLVGKLMKPL